MSATLGVVVVIAGGCALLWALLAARFALGSQHPSRWRAAGAAAILVAPFFVVVELWFLALAVQRSWPPLPWVIAAGGAIAAGVLVPLMATRTPRLAPNTRRRAVTNMAVIIVSVTWIAELFVFEGFGSAGWIVAVLSIVGLVARVFSRRKSRAG
ncbi:MAG: hypothetical protein QOF71_3681 [Candidatus Eremiobacteraeota bacterium]|jgi:hypothetical protein|nr:hypothetical protein [Candidatus Eremiobacteraeota bacterium]